YSFFEPYKVIFDRVNTFRPGVQARIVAQAPLGMVFPGDDDITARLVPADKKNFAPRVGIAWDPLGTRRLGTRASYRLFREDHRTDPWIYPAVNQPFVIRKMIFNPVSLTDPYQGQDNPFPYVYTPAAARFSLPMGLFTVPARTVANPYVHHLSFTV